MSRLTLIVAGTVLMGIVIVPVHQAYMGMEDARMQSASESIADMVDAFFDSEVDEMYIRGWEVMPSSNCQLTIDGYEVAVKNGDKEYVSYMSHMIERASIGYTGTIVAVKGIDGISLIAQ